MSTPIQTFRRAMRRHEKRAKRMGLPRAAREIASHRKSPNEHALARLALLAAYLGASKADRSDVRAGFLCYLAWDAVAKFLAAQGQRT